MAPLESQLEQCEQRGANDRLLYLEIWALIIDALLTAMVLAGTWLRQLSV